VRFCTECKLTLANGTLLLLFRSESWVFENSKIYICELAILDELNEEFEDVESNVIQVNNIMMAFSLIMVVLALAIIALTLSKFCSKRSAKNLLFEMSAAVWSLIVTAVTGNSPFSLIVVNVGKLCRGCSSRSGSSTASRVVVAEFRRRKREVMLFKEGLLPVLESADSLLGSEFGEELLLVFLVLYCDVISKFNIKRWMNIQQALFDLVLVLYLRCITYEVEKESIFDILNFLLFMASGKVLARRFWVDLPGLFGVVVEAIFAT
jgi:hypothetical protein